MSGRARRWAVPALALAGLLGGCGDGDEPAATAARPAHRVAAPAHVARATPPRAGRLPRYESAALVRPTTLRARPGGPVLAHLARRTEFGSPRILSVIGRRGGWLRVLDAALPDGRSGWISGAGVLMYPVTWRVDVSLARRQVTVAHGGRVVQRFTVAVGRAASPTPTGRFAVTDKVKMRDPHGAYGCCALALTGHQPRVPQGWGGGDRLAIHGTSQPGSIGLAASLGCLRAGEADVKRLIDTVPLGAPVFIRA
jgi:L,D-transpeptidase catalytic domain